LLLELLSCLFQIGNSSNFNIVENALNFKVFSCDPKFQRAIPDGIELFVAQPYSLRKSGAGFWLSASQVPSMPAPIVTNKQISVVMATPLGSQYQGMPMIWATTA
jgi:hypothetical protein